jgi:hypothetical protein
MTCNYGCAVVPTVTSPPVTSLPSTSTPTPVATLAQPSGTNLAFTGTDVASTLGTGLALILGGLFVTIKSRRRKH